MRLPDRLGFRGKTLWDWLQLLIVPVMLIAVTLAWSALQSRSENQRAEERRDADRAAAEEARRDATLQDYLDQMSDLVLHEKLLSAETEDPVRAVARTVTLATLRRLDEGRQGQVVRFLSEAHLLEGGEDEDPSVFLVGANLADARLDSAFLDGAYLAGVNLRGSNLAHAELVSANLSQADLRGANLAGTNLAFAVLRGAKLAGADLREADLEGAELDEADLRGADLAGADLVNREGTFGANLEKAKLSGAKNLNLARFITELSSNPEWPLASPRERFLDSQKAFLDSLSPKELAKFHLSPEKLAKLRGAASGG